MLKKAILILLLVPAAAFFAACSPAGEEQPGRKTGTYLDYIGVNAAMGVEAGDVYGDLAHEVFAAGKVLEFGATADMLENLRLGRVDALLLSDGFSRQLQDSGRYPDFDYLLIPEDVFINKAGPIFHTEELRDIYNQWFVRLAADETWREVVNRWIGVPLPDPDDIPKFELTGENGTLRVCDTGNYPPLSYFDANGALVGFDMEMVSRFAEHLGMDLEVSIVSYEDAAAFVISGKADMSACTLAITGERGEGMFFGEPSVITQAVLIVPKD